MTEPRLYLDPGPTAPGARMGALLRDLGARAGAVSAHEVARQAVFLAALLTAWISLKPFPSLSGAELGDLVTGQEALTYATFGALSAAAVALVVPRQRRALASCLSPPILALAGWLGLSVVLSQDPATSGKRLTLTVAVAVLAACLPLLARSRIELRNLLATAALTLLAVCYLGLVVAPEVSIHQLGDFLEPSLAGNWRGSFGHKNVAGAVMAMLLFVGTGVFRSGARSAGLAIVLLAGLFLIGSEDKSALALGLLVFAVTGLFTVVRSLPGRALLAFGPVVLLNLFTVGTVVHPGLAAIVQALPVDATFTGRTAIWQFAVESFAARPIAGHGFVAFWSTHATREVASTGGSWAGLAAHSHNGYLDSALTLGLVGLGLTVLVLVVTPLRNYQRACEAGSGSDPLATMFLQIWLFGVLLSVMESFFYDRADPIWATFLVAVFALHYLARFRTR